MGLKVIDEIPHRVEPGDSDRPVWIHDFGLVMRSGAAVKIEAVKALFEEAFSRVWSGETENDGFSKLVLGAGLASREIVILRAYCKYLLQASIPFSQAYMEETLARNTGIARDIVEDASMGRIYLPSVWLAEANIVPEEIAAPENREKLAMLTLRLLREAERYYRSGDEGLWHLSFRSACAVAAARNVYSEIGALLQQKGARAWDERTYVTGARKIRVVLRGILALLRSVPARLFKPWSPAPLRVIWKASHIQ